MKHSNEELKALQCLPLEIKVKKTRLRIREWYEHWDGDVYVSFSGGKDSTVLLHMVRQIYPDVEAVFVNTGLEYPEIQQFVKTFDNVTILRPKMRFDEVIRKYGYPIISKEVSECVSQGRIALLRNDGAYHYRLSKLKGTLLDKSGNLNSFNQKKYEPLLYTDFLISNKCCALMKKNPSKQFEKVSGKKPMTAQTAAESKLRMQQWLQNGCNGFEMKSPISNPMSFWTEQDVLRYIKIHNVPIASVYGNIVEIGGSENTLFGTVAGDLKTTGCDRTGCIFCAFGCHLEKGESRFERLKKTHPRQYEYCVGGGAYDEDGIWSQTKKALVWDTCLMN